MNKKLVPHFIYGTAWKEEHTAELTYTALAVGYRAIDTANQRKHYYEEGVGLGIQKFLEQKTLDRKDLFLQTKFTFARGQDHRKPYNENDGFEKQVADSFASSLAHLHTNYLDSYVLHGPYRNEGIGQEDLETWHAMEAIFTSGKAHNLGVSNVSAEQLESLCAQVSIKPRFVQNRCYARVGWDHDVREVCREHGIFYQGFSLLTANQRELSTSLIADLASKYQTSIAPLIFRFSQQIGIIPLTGTTDKTHMQLDLDIEDVELSREDLVKILEISFV